VHQSSLEVVVLNLLATVEENLVLSLVLLSHHLHHHVHLRSRVVLLGCHSIHVGHVLAHGLHLLHLDSGSNLEVVQGFLLAQSRLLLEVGLGQLALLGSHHELSVLLVLGQLLVCHAELHLADADGVQNLIKDLLGGLVLLFGSFANHFSVGIPVLLLVGFTTGLGEVLASLLGRLAGLSANELEELEEVVGVHAALSRSGNYVELGLLELGGDEFFVDLHFGDSTIFTLRVGL